MSESVEIWDELEKMVEAEQRAIKKGIAGAEVQDVQYGLRKDFVDEEKLREWGLNPEDQIVRIILKAEWGDTLIETYRVSTNKRSNLYKYYINYGKPQAGQKVTIKYDKTKSRWRVLL